MHGRGAPEDRESRDTETPGSIECAGCNRRRRSGCGRRGRAGDPGGSLAVTSSVSAVHGAPRNEAYAAVVRDAIATGSSPADFPAEHYERDWTNRFHLADLNATGRRGLGIDS